MNPYSSGDTHTHIHACFLSIPYTSFLSKTYFLLRPLPSTARLICPPCVGCAAHLAAGWGARAAHAAVSPSAEEKLKASRQRKSKETAPPRLPSSTVALPFIPVPAPEHSAKLARRRGRGTGARGRPMAGCWSRASRSPESPSPAPRQLSPPGAAARRTPRLPGGPEPMALSRGAKRSRSQVAASPAPGAHRPARRPRRPRPATRAALCAREDAPRSPRTGGGRPSPGAAAHRPDDEAPRPRSPGRALGARAGGGREGGGGAAGSLRDPGSCP